MAPTPCSAMVVMAAIMIHFDYTGWKWMLAMNLGVGAIFLVLAPASMRSTENKRLRIAGSRFYPLVGEQAEDSVDRVRGEIAAVKGGREVGHRDGPTFPRPGDQIGYLVYGGQNRKAHADKCASGSRRCADLILLPQR